MTMLWIFMGGGLGALLRFTLSQADVHTTIVGTASADHLAANLAAAKAGPLSDDVTAETRRRLEAATAN